MWLPAGIVPPRWRRYVQLDQHANLVEVGEPAIPEKLNCKPGSQGRAMERSLNPKICKKQKGIAMRRENHQKCMSMKSKELIYARVDRFGMEKAYGK